MSDAEREVMIVFWIDFPSTLISFALLRKKEVEKQTHSVTNAALSILLFRPKLAGHMEKVYWS